MKITHPLHLFVLLLTPFLLGFMLREIIAKTEQNQAVPIAEYVLVIGLILGLISSLIVLFKQRRA